MTIYHHWRSSAAKTTLSALLLALTGTAISTASAHAGDLQPVQGMETIPHVPVIFSTPPVSSQVGYPSNSVVGSGNPNVTLYGSCGLGACTSVPITISNEGQLLQIQRDIQTQRTRERSTNEKLRDQRLLN